MIKDEFLLMVNMFLTMVEFFEQQNKTNPHVEIGLINLLELKCPHHLKQQKRIINLVDLLSPTSERAKKQCQSGPKLLDRPVLLILQVSNALKCCISSLQGPPAWEIQKPRSLRISASIVGYHHNDTIPSIGSPMMSHV